MAHCGMGKGSVETDELLVSNRGNMRTTDIADAAPLLDELIRNLELGREDGVGLVEGGRRVAKPVPAKSSKRVGNRSTER